MSYRLTGPPGTRYDFRMSTENQNKAIVFADVSGSTKLYEKLGDQEALAAIELVLGEIRKSVTLQKGQVVKTIGDEIMAAFDTADMAMQAACDMQNRVFAIPQKNSVKLAIRIGFHYGPVIPDGGDYYGDAVNVAARMAGVAKAEQIITTWPTVKELSPLLSHSTRDLDTVSVKGKQEEMRIFEVMWHDSDDVTTLATKAVTAPKREGVLKIRCGEQALELSAARPNASMGRDATNDLVTADKMASRVHAKIEFRGGHFHLSDQSSNGTYVTFGDDVEILLKREQVMLRGRGILCFGHSAAGGGPNVVSFEVG
jgi:adenylate cyclase